MRKKIILVLMAILLFQINNLLAESAKEIVTKATEQLHTEKTEQIDIKIDEMIKRTNQSVLNAGNDLSFAVAYVNDVFEFEVVG